MMKYLLFALFLTGCGRADTYKTDAKEEPIMDYSKFSTTHDGLTASILSVVRQQQNLTVNYQLTFTDRSQWELKGVATIFIVFYDDAVNQLGDRCGIQEDIDLDFLAGRVDSIAFLLRATIPFGATQFVIRFGASDLIMKLVPIPASP